MSLFMFMGGSGLGIVIGLLDLLEHIGSMQSLHFALCIVFLIILLFCRTRLWTELPSALRVGVSTQNYMVVEESFI